MYSKQRMKLLEVALDFVPEPIFAIDLDKKVILWNKAMEELFGVERKDILGKGDYEYSYIFYKERRPTLIDLVLEPNEECENLYKNFKRYPSGDIEGESYIKEKGYYDWGKASKILDDEGNVIGAITISRDMSNYRRIQAEMDDNKRRYEVLFENSPDAIAYLDSLHRVVDINLSFTSIFGYTLDECKGKDLDEIVSKEGRSEEAKAITKVLFEKGDVKQKVVRYTKDSKPIDVQARGILVKNEDAVIGAYGMYTDIRELLKKEVELQEINEELEASNQELEAALNQLKAAEAELRYQYEKLEYMLYHDQLTGVYDRISYDKCIKQVDVKSNLPLTIIISDLNGLKLVNDAFGLKTGDKLLKRIARILKKNCPEDSKIVRVGGDEFSILLPKTDEFLANEIIEKIKSDIEKVKIEALKLSMSFGSCTKYNKKQNIYEIHSNAEDKMNRMKLFESPSMRGRTISTIIKTLHEKNTREEQHSHRVSELCVKMGMVMGLPSADIQELKTVGLLHDIGKIGIEESILNKPGRLTEEEMTQMKKHPEIGYRILSSVNDMAEMANYVLAHHERIDGKGYPKGLKGMEIPLQARIIAIADAYDAMTSHRSYRTAMSEKEAIAELLRSAGTQLDSYLVDVFVNRVIRR